MTTATEDRRTEGRALRDKSPRKFWPTGLPRLSKVANPTPPDWRTVVGSYALSMLSIILLALLFNLTVVSQVQHFTAQHRLYDQVRLSIAEGSVPIGQRDVNGELVEAGTPIAVLEIPRLDIREVVVEGSSSRQTKLGVGHRRDTPFPGQAGASVLVGRSAAYGGVFRYLEMLRPGDTVKVSTGQGTSAYRVLGARVGEQKLPALEPGKDGRLTLITSNGRPFQPSGVLMVDAELTSTAFPRPPVAIAEGYVDPHERMLTGDDSRVFSLSWLIQLLVAASIAAVWAAKRWNVMATWVVFIPVISMIALACADRVTDLLPNTL
ncbi:sortase [Nocardioides sp. WS12]|uniref:sortase n=1 Tax=Nocardioides sp. WS12 TaxID=2486272 RepID=UPI0015FB8AC6|nr:sortase [Nocardioides sp. WS12]